MSMVQQKKNKLIKEKKEKKIENKKREKLSINRTKNDILEQFDIGQPKQRQVSQNRKRVGRGGRGGRGG